MDKIYTIGSFSGWRDEVEGKLSENYELDDPRKHSQSSIARLVTDDMNSAMNCPVSLIYTPRGKRAGTMSYAELGASWAMGNTIIAVDENTREDELISKISSYSFENFDDATWWLNNPGYNDNREGLEVRDRTESREPYEGVLFAGNYNGIGNIAEMLGKKKTFLGNMLELEKFDSIHNQIDLIVANFEKGHDKKALFYMGMGYALKIPTILVEGNSVPYPPLLGLARRVLVGDKRHEQLNYYLENLKSQHISDEAVVYYNLMKKFD